MKKSIIIIAVLGFTVLNSIAQELSQTENALLDNYMKSIITSERERIVSDTLARVFPGTILRLKAGFAENDGISFCTESHFILKNGKLVEITRDSLMLIMKPGFFLKSDADAKIFETALDKVFPVSWSNEDVKKRFKKANKWYFTRDDFFEFYSGYEATVDANGKVTALRYDMKVIAK